MILGEEARALGMQEKWDLLAPHLKQHGREALSYATLQQGMEYYVDDLGYVAFTSIRHPVFAPRVKRIVLADPVCSREDLGEFMGRFLELSPRAILAVASEHCAETLRPLGFKANCVGYEPEIPVQTYNTRGNWKDLDQIKRARNETRREEIAIREVAAQDLDRAALDNISAQWIKTKKVNDREIWIYARRPVFEREEGVRKFVAFDREGAPIGFAFYDPIYEEGSVVGYSANIVRCDEQRYRRLATSIHMTATDVFREEGAQTLNLCLAPFVELEEGRFNDDRFVRSFFDLSARFGNEIYNFNGLAFHKSKYRAPKKSLYFVSNSLLPSNDIYLAFLTSDITKSYASTMGRFLAGIVKGTLGGSEK